MIFIKCSDCRKHIGIYGMDRYRDGYTTDIYGKPKRLCLDCKIINSIKGESDTFKLRWDDRLSRFGIALLLSFYVVFIISMCYLGLNLFK
jgi:hypothetical protein